MNSTPAPRDADNPPEAPREEDFGERAAAEQDASRNLPALHQATLDPATLEALFEDIRQRAKVTSVIVKERASRHASEQPISLEEGRSRFLSGQARGLQVRYFYEQEEWWDTLARTVDGVRLTRIRHRFDAAPPPSND